MTKPEGEARMDCRDAVASEIKQAFRDFDECRAAGDAIALNTADRILALSAPVPTGEGEAVAWRPPDELPAIKPGDYAYRIVAVRRAHSGKVYSFGAYYLNAVSLWFDDDNEHRAVTGWNSDKGEDEPLYSPLLGAGDELVGWCEFPLYAHPKPAQWEGVEALREKVARAVAKEIERQDYNLDWSPDAEWDLTWAYIDQGEVDFGLIADAILAALTTGKGGEG